MSQNTYSSVVMPDLAREATTFAGSKTKSIATHNQIVGMVVPPGSYEVREGNAPTLYPCGIPDFLKLSGIGTSLTPSPPSTSSYIVFWESAM